MQSEATLTSYSIENFDEIVPLFNEQKHNLFALRKKYYLQGFILSLFKKFVIFFL